MMYRQGDVLIVRISETAAKSRRRETPPEDGRIVVMHGEATGHAHALSAEHVTAWRGWRGDQIFLRVERLTKLTHEEHDPIPLPRGWYQVVRQREYVPRRRGTAYVRD